MLFIIKFIKFKPRIKFKKFELHNYMLFTDRAVSTSRLIALRDAASQR